MKFKPCSICTKLKALPFKVMEQMPDGTYQQFMLCKTCYADYVSTEQLTANLSQAVDTREPTITTTLGVIQTAEQLAMFMAGMHQVVDPGCPNCGLSLAEFDENGRMGCPTCYTHFSGQMEQLVFPYHGAQRHVGKTPKRKAPPPDPSDQMKILKLKFARAVEFEDYESAAVIKKEIERVTQLLA